MKKKTSDRRSTKGRAQGANGEQHWPEIRVRPMRQDSWIDPVESHKRYPVRRWTEPCKN